MIITITGKPCSGKGTVSKYICNNYEFEYVCTGDMIRNFAKQLGYSDLVEFQKSKDIKNVDKLVDGETARIGKERSNENILIDSRLAWHFVPKSFKVFVDVDIDVASHRLIEAKRENEHFTSIKDAKQSLIDRWNVENTRYKKIYGVDNTNLSQYDLVISSNDKTPEELGEIIMKEYKIFTQNA